MRRSVVAIVVSLLIGLGIPAVASAHVLKVDGHIGAVLHIEPDDNPTTGKPTTYILAFTDDTNKFDLSMCDCGVHIIDNGKTIYSHTLQITDPTDSIDTYTFQKPAVYTMEFTGMPKIAGGFQPFKLDYEVRVGQTASKKEMPVLLWVGIGAVMGLILLAAYAMNYDSDERTKRANRSHQ